MLDFYLYKHKRRGNNNLLIANTILAKGKTFQVQTDFELMESIINLAKELGQSHQKVIRDILDDFFLDQELAKQKYELEGIE